MPRSNPYAKYEDVKFSTSNKGNLILLLYDGTIRFLEEAKKRMEVNDYSGKGLYLDRAFSAINELRTSLNFEADQKLADSLNQLYFFMTKQLSKATIDNDTKALDLVIELLRGLRVAWAVAVKKESANPSIKPANVSA